MNQLVAIIIVSFLIAIGRFTIPGHALTGWSGFFETLAHIWVGAMIVLAYYMPKLRWAIVVMLVSVTVVEVVMFLVDQHK